LSSEDAVGLDAIADDGLGYARSVFFAPDGRTQKGMGYRGPDGDAQSLPGGQGQGHRRDGQLGGRDAGKKARGDRVRAVRGRRRPQFGAPDDPVEKGADTQKLHREGFARAAVRVAIGERQVRAPLHGVHEGDQGGADVSAHVPVHEQDTAGPGFAGAKRPHRARYVNPKGLIEENRRHARAGPGPHGGRRPVGTSVHHRDYQCGPGGQNEVDYLLYALDLVARRHNGDQHRHLSLRHSLRHTPVLRL